MKSSAIDQTRMVVRSGLIALALLGVATSFANAAPPYGSPGYAKNWNDDGFGKKKRRIICVPGSSYKIRSRVEEQGYLNVYLGGEIGRSGNLEVRATRGDDVYLLEVDKCSGKVEAENYLRPAVNGR